MSLVFTPTTFHDFFSNGTSLENDLFFPLANLPRSFHNSQLVANGQQWKPAVDIKEEDKRYIVEAEIPGAKKEDISIEFTGESHQTLKITGKISKSSRTVNPEAEDVTAQNSEGSDLNPSKPLSSVWRSERFEGSFSRSFKLPTQVDPSKVTARYEDGILIIEVLKKVKEQTETRKIEIQ